MKRCAALGRNDCVLFLLFFEFCVFASCSAQPTPFGDKVFDGLRIYRPLCESDALRGPPFWIARKREKSNQGDCGPLGSPDLMRDIKPDVLWLYVFAMVQLTRLSRRRCREANTLGVRCRLFPCLCVLRCQGYGSAYDFSGHRSRHEGVGISGAPPLIKIRAGHQCEFVWY